MRSDKGENMFSYFAVYDEAKRLGLTGNNEQMFVQLRADYDWLVHNACVANAQAVANRVSWVMNTLSWPDEVRNKMVDILRLTHDIMQKAHENHSGNWEFIPISAAA